MKYLFGTVCVVCAAYLLGKGESYWGWFLFVGALSLCKVEL